MTATKLAKKARAKTASSVPKVARSANGMVDALTLTETAKRLRVSKTAVLQAIDGQKPPGSVSRSGLANSEVGSSAVSVGTTKSAHRKRGVAVFGHCLEERPVGRADAGRNRPAARSPDGGRIDWILLDTDRLTLSHQSLNVAGAHAKQPHKDVLRPKFQNHLATFHADIHHLLS